MKTPKYNMIVAVDDNWCIGNRGKLLASIPQDMKYFKAITTHKAVIMGKRTQESLPNHLYLKNRINIVLDQECTSNHHDVGDDTRLFYLSDIDIIPYLVKTINEDLISNTSFYKFDYLTDGDIFVVGGGQIYKEFLRRDMIDTVFLTQIHHKYDCGDTYIPNLYELGFSIHDTLLPSSKTDDGIEYEILVLKK